MIIWLDDGTELICGNGHTGEFERLFGNSITVVCGRCNWKIQLPETEHERIRRIDRSDPADSIPSSGWD